jgi:DNA polymerase/3'-5' exonuclease PolX
MAVTANYTQPAPTTYSLTVNSSGATNVRITSSTGQGGTTNYSRTVNRDTSVTLTAPAEKNGKTFNGWTGSFTSSNRSIHFIAKKDMRLVAQYGSAHSDDPHKSNFPWNLFLTIILNRSGQ